MRSFGSLARFSAHSVSITPASGRSCARLKPLSFQNVRTCGKTCSGVRVVLSQRSLPRRSILKAPRAVGATVGVAVAAAATASRVGAVGVKAAGVPGAVGVAAPADAPGAAGVAAVTGAPGVAAAVWKVDALTTPLEGW